MNSQKPENLKKFRSVFYDLLLNQVPSEDIIVEITRQLVLRLNNSAMALKIKRESSDIQRMLKKGDKDLIYLESFACNLMCLLSSDS